jgi:hypothetical protein
MLLPRHSGGLLRTSLVIVAQQVEDAVHQETDHFVEQPMPPFCRLPPSGRHRNDDIAY